MDLVSIIIPIYNKEKFLKKTVLSVLNQSYKNFELLLLNDGSQDASDELIKDFVNKDGRVKHLSHDNQGVSFTRNRGITESRGKYISFLDADDTWEPNFLEKMIKKIGDSDICYCGHQIIDNNKKINSNFYFTKDNVLGNYLKNRTPIHTNSWLIKKELLINNNIFFPENITWGEDAYFFSLCLFFAEKISYVKEFLTNYYVGNEGNLSAFSLNKIESDIEWTNNLISIFSREQSNDVVEILKGFKQPLLVINRLLSGVSVCKKEEIKLYYDKYLDIIDSFKFNNGIESLKLFIRKRKLRKYINKESFH